MMRCLIFALLALFALTGCDDAMKMADDIIVDTETEAPSTSLIDDKEYVEVWLRDPSRDVTLQIPGELNYLYGTWSNRPEEGLNFHGFIFYEDRIFAPDLNGHENHEFSIHTGAYLGSFSAGEWVVDAKKKSVSGGYIAKNPTGKTLMWQKAGYRLSRGAWRETSIIWDIDARKVVGSGPSFANEGGRYVTVINDIFYLHIPVSADQATRTFTAYEPYTDFTQFPLPAYDFTTEPTHFVIPNLDTTHPEIETYGRDPNHWDILFHTEDALYMFNAYLTSDGVRTIHGDYERTWHEGIHKWDVPSGRYVGEVYQDFKFIHQVGDITYHMNPYHQTYNKWTDTLYLIMTPHIPSTAEEQTTLVNRGRSDQHFYKHAWHKRDVKFFAFTKQ